MACPTKGTSSKSFQPPMARPVAYRGEVIGFAPRPCGVLEPLPGSEVLQFFPWNRVTPIIYSGAQRRSGLKERHAESGLCEGMHRNTTSRTAADHTHIEWFHWIILLNS